MPGADSIIVRIVFFSLGIFCLVFGGILFLAFNSIEIRLIGLGLVAASAVIFGKTRRNVTSNIVSGTDIGFFMTRWRSFIQTWPVGAAALLSVFGSLYLLNLDSMAGGQSIMAVMYFTASGVFAMVYWIYLGVRKSS